MSEDDLVAKANELTDLDPDDMQENEIEKLKSDIGLLVDAIEEKIDEIEDDEDAKEIVEQLEEKKSELEDLADACTERLETALWCVIDGDIVNVDKVNDHGYLPMIEEGKREWYVAEDADTAGHAARKYWEDLAENDPSELACIIGEKNLIQWGLGQYAGPGSTHVKSLSEWLDLWLDTPEEQWAGYDGAECEVEFTSQALVDELGFDPEVAYRHN